MITLASAETIALGGIPRDAMERGELRQTEPSQVRRVPLGSRMQTGLLGRRGGAAITGDCSSPAPRTPTSWSLSARARLLGNWSDEPVLKKLVGQVAMPA
jgi:hypothetical protein